VVGLAWSKVPESIAGSRVATGRVSLARQVKGNDADEKGYAGPPYWGLGLGLTSPRKKFMSRKAEGCLGWDKKNGGTF
jgi:hypothetical protein